MHEISHHCSECGAQVEETCERHPDAAVESIASRDLAIEILARDCAREARSQGLVQLDPQAAILDGDAAALDELVGREATHREEAVFDAAYREWLETH